MGYAMNAKIIDARKLPCPQPLILTSKALKGLSQGDQLTILVDNETAKENVTRYLKDQGMSVTVLKNGDDFELSTLAHSSHKAVDATQYCQVESQDPLGNHVIVYANETLGSGPSELGNLLIQGFSNTLKNLTPLPSSIIFYTNGVKLVIEGSPLIATFKELESLGVKFLVCGTCLDYFKVKSELRVGQVSNMLTILEELTTASKVIYP